jgi:hypothetical protein
VLRYYFSLLGSTPLYGIGGDWKLHPENFSLLPIVSHLA